MMRVGLGVEVVLVLLLVVSVRSHHPARYVLKPLASIGFVMVAVASTESFSDRYYALVVLGLVLGLCGDVALLFESHGPFLVGLVAFLAGHVAYAFAFAGEVRPLPVTVGATAALLLAVFSYRWLRPHLPSPFRVAVPVYVSVICVMVALGVGQSWHRPLAGAGSVLFAGSDLLVAREQFVSRSVWNPTIGLPIYYLSQILIALSV